MTSVTAWMLCKLIKESGLPDGVVNVVFGVGPRAGEAMINHPDVNVDTYYSILFEPNLTNLYKSIPIKFYRSSKRIL